GLGRGPADTGTVRQSAQNVELIGQIGGRTRAVAVEGAYAYAGIGTWLGHPGRLQRNSAGGRRADSRLA
ncbi:MAG: hypothetical protein ACE5LU_23860, partial [Anaerolineae bacterium]